MKPLKKDVFFKKMDNQGIGLSYDDALLKTGSSKVKPINVNLQTKFSRNVSLNIPIVSSPMDRVTEQKMAIEIAKLGGLGILHRSLSPEDQASQVARVKLHLNAIVEKPISVKPWKKVGEILRMIEERDYQFRSFLVTDENGRLVGLVSGNDFDFCIDPEVTIGDIMSTNPITVSEFPPLQSVFDIMRENKKKVLPVIDKEGFPIGLYVYSDIRRIITGSSAIYNVDDNGNLRVGIAVGIGEDALRRVELCAAKKVDVVVIDTAHGDTPDVINTLKKIKKKYLNIDVVAGNVSEAESAKRLILAGADGIRDGQGPGSICTTRVIAGIGNPQLTAVYECSKIMRGSGVPLCADGGIKFSGHITRALGAGAECVMLGNLLAGTEESPGPVILLGGLVYKDYRGMGSLGAMEESEASRMRYGQSERTRDKLVPEGIEGLIPFRGPVSKIIFQLLGGLRSGMGYVGAKTIQELQRKADYRRVTTAGNSESHPHGVKITKNAPNYECGL